MDKEHSRWGLVGILILGLLLRVGYVAYQWPTIAPQGHLKDTDSYGRLALNLVKFGTYGFPIEPVAKIDSPDQLTDQVNGKASDEAVFRRSPQMRPTAYRPPVYPALLTVAVIPDLVNGVPLAQLSINAFVVAGLHVLFGLVTIGLVHYIAWRLELRWAWLPALAVAVDPILLRWSGEIMTETIITMWTVWAWALYLVLVRPRFAESGRRVLGMQLSLRASLALGFVLGLAVLTRPTMLPWAVLVVASLCLRRSQAGQRITMITAALIVMSIPNIAWLVRNHQQFGKPIATTTHGGYTLLLANNPPLYEHFRVVGPDRNWDADPFHKLWAMRRSGDPKQPEFWNAAVPEGPVQEPDIDEWKDDRLAQEAAKATIQSDPKTFALSCLYRAGWLWAIYPNVSEDQIRQRWIIGLWYGFWFAMAIVGLGWIRTGLASRVWLMPLLLVLTLTAIHMIYWSNMRMRAPLMPIVYIVACWPLMTSSTARIVSDRET